MTASLMGLQVAGVIAILARVAGVVVTAPVLGSPAIPRIVRIALVLGLGLATWSILPPVVVGGGSAIGIIVVAAGEFAVGAVIGFLASLPLIAMQMGGTLAGKQMGLALPAMLDPASGMEVDDLGRAFLVLAVVAFVVVGGVEQVYAALLGSFEHLPVAALGEQGLATTAAGLMDACLEFALRVAAPLIAVLLLQTAVLAIVARSMPQLNIFSVGLPLRLLVGLVVLVLGLHVLGTAMETFIPTTLRSITEWGGGAT